MNFILLHVGKRHAFIKMNFFRLVVVILTVNLISFGEKINNLNNRGLTLTNFTVRQAFEKVTMERFNQKALLKMKSQLVIAINEIIEKAMPTYHVVHIIKAVEESQSIDDLITDILINCKKFVV